MKVIEVTTANQMLQKVKETLPVDIAVCAAAVCDFKVEKYNFKKIKKNELNKLDLRFEKNDDILQFISKHNSLRPKLVVGFSAEINQTVSYSKKKLKEKYCDWIIANDVSRKDIGFNSENNEITIIYKDNNNEKINKDNKSIIAKKISKKIINRFI